MEYTLAGAAQATGIAKTTIFRAIKSGKLSAKRLDDRTYRIDASELTRVYPIVAAERSRTPEKNVPQQQETPATFHISEVEVAVLRTKLEMMEAQLARERDLREQEREGVEREREATRDTVADLRKRLDRAEERVLALTALPSPPAALPLPAAEIVTSAPLAAPRSQGGFLSRLFGRS